MLKLLCLLIFSPVVFAQNTELQCIHVLPIQMRYLQRHVNFTKITPDLEKRTIEQFLKRLDGSKFILLEADYQEISRNMQGIFEKTRRQDCSPLIKAQEAYLKRVEERLTFAKNYLGAGFKLNPTAKIKTDPKARTRPKSKAEADAGFINELQYEVANYVSTDISLENAKKHVTRGYERLFKHVRDTKVRDIYSNYLDCYATALDPHTSYMSADALEEFQIQMRLSLDGIGATLSWQNGFTVIQQLIPGGSAANSGLLKRKDKIVGVAQGDGPFVETLEMELKDVIKMIRGPKGTPVRLKIVRKVANGKEVETQRLEVPLVRDKIKLDEQAASITYVEREAQGQKLKIGILNLPSFYHDDRKDGPSAAGDLKKLLAEAVKNKADSVVLDLSNNGGGSLPDAVDVTGLFIAKGEVVRLGERAPKEGAPMIYESLADEDPAVDWPGPLVILTNRGSASASEIVSGALQDYRRAIIVGGDHTFGKGSMQAVEYLNQGLGAVKTTTGMFFTAGGESTQHRGVDGDIVFPGPAGLDKYSEKALDYSLPPKKIPAFLSEGAYVYEGPAAWIPLEPDLLKRLKTKSTPRVAASAEFKKIRDELKKAQKKPSVWITVASLLKGKDPAAAKGDTPEDDKDDPVLTPAEKKKKYLERADVIEAANIAADLAVELKTAQPRRPASRKVAK